MYTLRYLTSDRAEDSVSTYQADQVSHLLRKLNTLLITATVTHIEVTSTDPEFPDPFPWISRPHAYAPFKAVS